MERRIEARRRQWRASARRWNDASLQQPEVEAAAPAARGTAAAGSMRSAAPAAASPGIPPARPRTLAGGLDTTTITASTTQAEHALGRRRPRATKLASDDRVSRLRLADAYESITVQRQRAARSAPSPSRAAVRRVGERARCFLLRAPKKVARSVEYAAARTAEDTQESRCSLAERGPPSYGKLRGGSEST